MLGIVRTVIAQGQSGLVFVNGKLKKALTPGVHWVFAPFSRVAIQLTTPERGRMVAAFLDGDMTQVTEVHYEIVEHPRRVTFVYRNSRLASAMRLPYVYH